MSKYAEHKTIVGVDYKVIDATTRNGADLIWVGVGDAGAWLSAETAGGLAAAIEQVIDSHRARTSDVPEMVTEVLNGRDIMLTSVTILERLRDAHPGRVGDYLDGVISARISLRAAGVEAVA
jgi:hypothetical protein